MPWTLVNQSKNHQLWSHSAINASGTNSSDALACGAFQQMDIQTLHTVHDDTSSYGTDWSNDAGTTWERAGAVITTAGVSGSTSRSVDGMPGALFRLTVTEVDLNASARLTPYVTLKKKG